MISSLALDCAFGTDTKLFNARKSFLDFHVRTYLVELSPERVSCFREKLHFQIYCSIARVENKQLVSLILLVCIHVTLHGHYIYFVFYCRISYMSVFLRPRSKSVSLYGPYRLDGQF